LNLSALGKLASNGMLVRDDVEMIEDIVEV
jgi:hypothetical protein